MDKQTFILNDETKVNQKGFRILNSGLDLERFKSNPVILDSHNNDTKGVIGRWENIKIEGHLLTAEPVFDTNSEQGKKIAEQVKNGFLKGCSLGIDPISKDNFVVNDSGELILSKGDIYEASIVAIPNNANALIRLYSSDAKMNDEVEKEYLKPFSINAEKIQKLQADLNQSNTDRDLFKLKYEELLNEKNQEKITLGIQILNNALKAGKITAQMKPRFENMLKLDFEGTIAILEEMKGKQNLSSQILNTDNDNKGLDKSKWKLDDYRKHAPLELRDNPNLYQRLVAEYNKENNNN